MAFRHCREGICNHRVKRAKQRRKAVKRGKTKRRKARN